MLGQGQLGDRVDNHQAADDAGETHPTRARRGGAHGGDQHAGTDDGLGGDGSVNDPRTLDGHGLVGVPQGLHDRLRLAHHDVDAAANRVGDAASQVHGDTLDVLEVGGAQEEAGDGAGQAEGAHDLPHGLLAGRGHGRPQGVGIRAGDGLGDLQEIEAIADQVDDLAGQIRGAVVSTGDDRGVHAPVVGDDVLEVIVGDQEDLEFTVSDRECHERQVAEVPALLLGGQLGEQRTVSLRKLEVTQVHALEGREERHGRGGGATDFDDAGRGGFDGCSLLVIGGPDLAQRRVALGQVVGRRVTDAHLGVEEDGEFVSQFGGGGSGNDLS